MRDTKLKYLQQRIIFFYKLVGANYVLLPTKSSCLASYSWSKKFKKLIFSISTEYMHKLRACVRNSNIIHKKYVFIIFSTKLPIRLFTFLEFLNHKEIPCFSYGISYFQVSLFLINNIKTTSGKSWDMHSYSERVNTNSFPSIKCKDRNPNRFSKAWYS